LRAETKTEACVVLSLATAETTTHHATGRHAAALSRVATEAGRGRGRLGRILLAETETQSHPAASHATNTRTFIPSLPLVAIKSGRGRAFVQHHGAISSPLGIHRGGHTDVINA